MISLAAICLNEQAFIGNWLDYHYDSFDRIVICEGAARNYPRECVTDAGLSTDATADIIHCFPDRQKKIRFVQHGWAGSGVCTDDRVPAKMELRNVYAPSLADGYAFTLDVDEFLHPYHISRLVAQMNCNPAIDAYAIPQLHLWQNTSQFITGGYAEIPHFRLFRWKRGSRYTANHNWPSSPDGVPLIAKRYRSPLEVSDGTLSAPAIIHYGFCEPRSAMREKNRYYLMRGESATRPATSEFREAALAGRLPKGCAIHPYRGFLPFQPAWLGP